MLLMYRWIVLVMTGISTYSLAVVQLNLCLKKYYCIFLYIVCKSFYLPIWSYLSVSLICFWPVVSCGSMRWWSTNSYKLDKYQTNTSDALEINKTFRNVKIHHIFFSVLIFKIYFPYTSQSIFFIIFTHV